MKIDFYILETSSNEKSQLFACQLIEKIYSEQQKQIYINTSSRDEAERFDTLLWTYRDDSFLPHNLYNPLDDSPAPISVGFNEQIPDDSNDIMLNLSRDVPSFYQQFNHIIEIVFADTLVQQLARDRYKLYRSQGHTINTIKLKANET